MCILKKTPAKWFRNEKRRHLPGMLKKCGNLRVFFSFKVGYIENLFSIVGSKGHFKKILMVSKFLNNSLINKS